MKNSTFEKDFIGFIRTSVCCGRSEPKIPTQWH